MKPTERCVLDLVAAFVNSHSQISVVNGREFCITYIEYQQESKGFTVYIR